MEQQASELVFEFSVSYIEIETLSDNVLNVVVEIEEAIEETRELIKVHEMEAQQEMESQMLLDSVMEVLKNYDVSIEEENEEEETEAENELLTF